MQTILWGSMGPDSHSVDTALEQAVGKRQSLPHLAMAWAYGRKADGTPNYAPFPVQPSGSYAFLQRAWAGGQPSLMDWNSWDLNNQTDPAFSLDQIIGGAHDPYLHAWAHDAAAWGHPVLIRFNSEMNGNWWAWGAQPAKFIAAWRKVVGIFQSEGARNVSWAWVANVVAPPGTTYPTAQDKLASYYPGDDAVDWTGFDAYNEGSHKGVFDASGNLTGGWLTPWMTFSQITSGYPIPGVPHFSWLGDTYDAIRAIAPGKPMLIGEFNSDDRGGDKAAWLADALTIIPRQFPLIRAISLFNWNADGNAHWALGGSQLTAFAAGIASPVYLSAGDWTPADMQSLPAPPSLSSITDSAALQSQLAQSQQLASNLNAQIASLSNQVSALNGQVATQAAALQTAQDKVSRYQSAASQLANGLSGLEALAASS